MRLALFGATGGVGRQILAQAMDGGHEIIAIARDPHRLAAATHTVQADLDQVSASVLGEAIEGCDAVLSAIGPARSADAGITTRATTRISAAMTERGVTRLVAVSAAPVSPLPTPGRPHPPRYDPGDDLLTRLVLGPLVRRLFRANYADLAGMEDVLRAGRLDWTVVRPPRLSHGPLTGIYRSAAGRNLPYGRFISRADLAHLMLSLLGQPQTIGQTIGVAY